MFCLPGIRYFRSRASNKYFCGVSLVMYLVFYNYSNAGPECQARILSYTDDMSVFKGYNPYKVV